VICKNCGRTIRKDEDYYQIKTEASLASPASGPVSKPEGVWFHVYDVECGVLEVKALKRANP